MAGWETHIHGSYQQLMTKLRQWTLMGFSKALVLDLDMCNVFIYGLINETENTHINSRSSISRKWLGDMGLGRSGLNPCPFYKVY